MAPLIDGQDGAEIALIGLGVIGGSAALRLHERGTALRGFSSSAADRAAASAAGIDVAASLDEAVNGVGVVLIAVPLDQTASVAEAVIGCASPRATILHAASLQRAEALRGMPEVMGRIIGTHPLAGSHLSGFRGARADLFRDATVFVERRANAPQREDAELLWSLSGARRIEYATAAGHDDAMAWISHLPQLASTALGSTLAWGLASMSSDTPVPRPGPGASDATRLAMSTLEMWQPILERAPAATSLALRALEGQLQRLRLAIEQQDSRAMQEIWETAHGWRAAAEREEGA